MAVAGAVRDERIFIDRRIRAYSFEVFCGGACGGFSSPVGSIAVSTDRIAYHRGAESSHEVSPHSSFARQNKRAAAAQDSPMPGDKGDSPLAIPSFAEDALSGVDREVQ